MMRRQSLIALGVAIVLGLIAVYLANVFLTTNEKKAEEANVGMAKIAVAAVPLSYGVELTPDKIRFINYPANTLPSGSYGNISELLPMGKKRVALLPIAVNEPILAGKISGEGQGASIAALLPDGKRAVSVRINDVSGVSGFVQPNDSVDVLVTRQVIGGRGDMQVTDVLLQNIKVMAIGQNAKDADGKPQLANTATLEVEPIDAQKLALAQQIGQLNLVLRKPGAQENNPIVETVSLEDLRYDIYGGTRYPQPTRVSFAPPQALAPAPRPQAARAAPVVRAPSRPSGDNVEVFRGTNRSNYEVGRYGS